MSQFFYATPAGQFGPVDRAGLENALKSRIITAETKVRMAGRNDWFKLGTLLSATPAAKIPESIFLWRNEQSEGPFTIVQIRNMWANGALHGGINYFANGMSEWQPLSDLAEELDGTKPVITPQPINLSRSTQSHRPVVVTVAKSRGAYIVLGIFLGCLGIHNFYAGYYGRAVAQMLTTFVIGTTLIFPLVFVVLWVIVELVAVDQDASGNAFS